MSVILTFAKENAMALLSLGFSCFSLYISCRNALKIQKTQQQYDSESQRQQHVQDIMENYVSQVSQAIEAYYSADITIEMYMGYMETYLKALAVAPKGLSKKIEAIDQSLHSKNYNEAESQLESFVKHLRKDFGYSTSSLKEQSKH